MSYLPTFSQPTRWWLPPPSGLSWNIYGKFCLFVQTSEVSQFRPPSSPSSAFIFFIWHLSLCAQPKLCNLPHPCVKWAPLFPSPEHRHFCHAYSRLKSWPFPPFFTHRSSEIDIFCNQHNLHFIKILFHLHKCTRNNTTHPSANVCFLAKASVIPLLSPACYHSLYVQRINVSPLLDAQMQKGNGAIWTEQCITLLFEQNQLSMQGTKQKGLLGTSSTTEITQLFGRKPQGVHGEKTQPHPVGMCYVTVAVRKGDKAYIALGNEITLLIQAAKIHTLTCRRLTVNS